MKHRKMKVGALILFQVGLIGGIVMLIRKCAGLLDMALKRNDFGAFTQIAGKTPELRIIRQAELQEKERIDRFVNSAPKSEYTIIAHDGIQLYAAAYTQKGYTQKWVIIVHGYSGDGGQMRLTAKYFYEKGFNVLLPDCRGHGKSGGKYITMGWHDRLDLLQWAGHVVGLDKKAAITLYGLSMGAATVLMASGEAMPKNVRCIIEDCGYTSVSDQFCYHLNKRMHLPSFPILNIAEAICKMKAGFRFSEASALEQVKKCKVPVLFIHGERDRFVPTHMAYRLYRAARCQKEIYIVPKAGHGVCANVGKSIYWKKVYDFTDRYCRSDIG